MLQVTNETFEERQLFYKYNFGFRCNCRACNIPKYEVNIIICIIHYTNKFRIIINLK